MNYWINKYENSKKPNPIIQFSNIEDFIVWGNKTLSRSQDWKAELELFLDELSEMVKRLHHPNDAIDASELYKKYPLVRVGIRRALLFIKNNDCS